MSDPAEPIRLFLCGDVMTGRGIDQILPHPGDPALHETYVRDAREYVRLAESDHGRIQHPVSFDYIWGDALDELRRFAPDARIVNLETSITTSNTNWDKEVLYRMNPRNIDCITAASIDCCCLANNHVIDWGRDGLEETLRTLDTAGVRRSGAGRNATEAAAPAVLDFTPRGRVVVFAYGSVTSGIPRQWAAADDRSGVNLLEDLSEETARRVASRVAEGKKPGDVLVVSIHWGPNWGYEVPKEQVDFAHRLIDAGVSIVHGHSSHHIKAVEVYRGGLILYGCGDFLTDYEGIGGNESFRGDLGVMYLLKIDAFSGRLLEAKLAPFQARRLRLRRAPSQDAKWLCKLLNSLGTPFHTRLDLRDDSLAIRLNS